MRNKERCIVYSLLAVSIVLGLLVIIPAILLASSGTTSSDTTKTGKNPSMPGAIIAASTSSRHFYNATGPTNPTGGITIEVNTTRVDRLNTHINFTVAGKRLPVAMECRPVANIKANLTPGTNLRILS